MVSVAKVLLGVVGVAVVVVLIAVPTAVYLNDDKNNQNQRSYTLDDVFNSSLKPKSYNMRWISDHEYLHKRNNSIFLHNVKTDEASEFLSSLTFKQVDAYDYQLSADRKYVAFMSNYTKVWRHSFTASYQLYDLENVAHLDKSDIPHETQYFAWAPQGNRMAFVWGNNVYIKSSPTSPTQQVTTNGKENVIFNGVPDWVYEEEMFSTSQGLWWSPGGKRLAYMESNDTDVHSIEYSWYGKDQYPRTVVIPYPKPGTPNPIVKLFVVDAAKLVKTQVVIPPSYGSGDHYLATVTWVTDEKVAVQWQKRKQNQVLLQIYDFDGSKWNVATKNLELISETGWIGRFSPSEPVFAADNSYYLLMSDVTGYKHIHHVVADKATPITFGTWEVISILKVTPGAVYYSSNEQENNPGGRNVYKWTPQGTQCLTCTLYAKRCQYNSAYFSHNASYYRMSCAGPGTPYHSLVDNVQNKEMKALEGNKDFDDLISDVRIPTMRHSTIKIGDYNLWYQMTLPPGFDESKKYPLLIDVYAGPCSQKADLRYQVSWSTYLASTEGVIVASFDGRGSGYQGDQIMHEIYQRLGTYEVEDQITAAREFIKMGFIDKNRIAIWGWSYGGYVTSMALGAGSGVFKCGMAVAPVSKWEYYDSIYTERYMLEPSENAAFYANSTVTERAKNFHSVEYLLVHGTADDNVHFQQAAQISKALVDEQVDFEAMWYTDKDHGLDGSAYRHVYTHMSHFLQRCFGLESS
ncbi:dipeptidyl peptidase 4-like isoform X2 [Genypterus blacodes]|uniref:dipeptidyl peptidase 4-like isoform X2 n=1 Tax=Genypterus blacodes TaxID=154954 RepID=UPI003F758465